MGVDGPDSRGIRVIRGALIGLAVALAILQLPLWALITLFFLVGGLQWPGQAPPPPDPWTGPLASWLVLNLVALLVFAVKHRGFGFWLLLGVQAVNAIAFFLFALQANLLPILLVSSGAAAVAVLLLLAIRFDWALPVSPDDPGTSRVPTPDSPDYPDI